MPRPRPPGLHKEISRHGRVVWYVRLDRGLRVRIRGDFGSPAFKAAYASAVAGEPVVGARPRPAAQGTLAWTIGLFRSSTAWSDLSRATRKQRDGILEKIAKGQSGSARLGHVTRADIQTGLKARAETPAAARHFLSTMRALFRWAIDEGLVQSDPTAGIITKAKRTEGHPVWTDQDIAAYEARWPVGTRERVAFDVLLFTGLRRGDAVVLGRQHVRDGVIRINTQKTGERVAIVMCAELQHTLDAGPCGDLTFIAGGRGRARVKESFGEWFRQACHAAGVRKSAHGLRKAAATRAANNGASEAQLEAMFGWRGGRMASLYTRSADRERLSLAAADTLARRKV